MGEDVINSTNQLFEQGWTPHYLNSTDTTLIPKQYGAYSIKKFRPFSLENFQFKIILISL